MKIPATESNQNLSRSGLIEPDTQRLILRQWRNSDFEAYARMNADPRVMEFYPSTLSREESDANARMLQGLIAQRGWGLWAIELKAGGAFIGYVGLHIPASDIPCSPCVEIGWRLAAEYWGQGYATEAAHASLHVGFTTLDLPEIVAFASTHNLRSRRVMDRLGMRHLGEYFEHPALPKKSPLREHVLYRLRQDEKQNCGVTARRNS